MVTGEQTSNAEPPNVCAPRDCVGQRSICTDPARQHIRFDHHPVIKLSPLQQCHYLWKIDVPLAQRSKDSLPYRVVEIQFPIARFGRFVLVNVFEVFDVKRCSAINGFDASTSNVDGD